MGEPTITSKSSETLQKGTELAFDLGLQMLVFEIPGFDLIAAVGMAIDLFDPYNYGKAVTKKALDDASKRAWDSLVQVFQSTKISEDINKRLDLALGLTEEQRRISKERMFSMWKQYKFIPTDYESCFQDFQNPTVDGPSLSGAPTEKCNATYKKAYEDYVLANKEKYTENAIKTDENIVQTTNEIRTFTAKKDIDEQRSGYLLTLYILIGLVAFSFVGVLIYFLVDKYTTK